MRYAIHFTQKNGAEHSFYVNNAIDRDLHLENMTERKRDYDSISYCKVYANGRYGENITVL